MSEMDDLDGLDDFGSDSDFSDQLDDFMDSDLGDDAGVDGDSELDSFFEDLSTIDDLEVKDEEPEEEAVAEAPEEPMESFDEEPEAPEEEEPKEKKPLLIPALISAAIGLVLGLIVTGAWYFFTLPPEDEPILLPSTTTFPPTTVPIPVASTFPPTTAPPVTLPPPPPPPKQTYFVQVANCIYQECVDDYRFLLKRFGYQAEIKKQAERTPMTEVVSQQVVGEEAAARWIERINRENQFPGQAFRQPAGSQYRVSLGLYPDLDTAIRVKTHLNQLYLRQLIFEAKRAEQVIEYTKIRVGGVPSREEAAQLQRILREKDERLQGAFVVGEVK